ncbi:MAG: rhodanese-like domain-containing protein [Acidobacteriota bacterium]|nr:rhodanese-like domain-containing protein [Acidobacteriota bacterium]
MRAQRRPAAWRAAAGLALLLAVAGCAPDALDWSAVERMIAEEFPDVPGLTTRELAERLAADPAGVVLLDARAAGEFAVSHLPGAHHVGSDAAAATRLAAAAPGAPLVRYCSVGYRSAALVERLRGMGHMNAVNLEGSIFRWAAEGRPAYRGAVRVAQVHPYDDAWGALLPRPLWAFAPDAPAP